MKVLLASSFVFCLALASISFTSYAKPLAIGFWISLLSVVLAVLATLLGTRRSLSVMIIGVLHLILVVHFWLRMSQIYTVKDDSVTRRALGASGQNATHEPTNKPWMFKLFEE